MINISSQKKAVLYLRYSSAGQTEQSIEGQRRVCRDYAERQGYQIIGEYIDRATSASHDTQKRLNFLRMVQDSGKRTFEAVIVYKLDRFARNRYDSANYKQKLKANGVRVVSATEGLTDSPESVMLESVLEGMAEYYSLELSQKVSRGIQESIEKRQFLGGPVPLGFTVKDKKLIPDPEQKLIVNEVFELVLQGKSLSDIARYLDRKGVRSKKGKPYSCAQVHRILQSKRYIGYYVYGDLEIPDVIEPIVSEELYESVQEKLKGRRFNKMRKADFLLTGKLYCGECGEPMTGESGTSSTGTVYHYYKCYGRRKKSGCSKSNVQREPLEQAVIDAARSCLNDETIDQLAGAVMEEYESSEKLSDADRIRSDLAAVKKEIDNFVALIGRGVMSDAVIQKLQESEARKVALENELKTEEEKNRLLTFEMIVFWLESIRGRAIEQDKVLIDIFVDRVELYDDEDQNNRKAVIRLSLCGKPLSSQTVTFGSPF